MTRADEHASKVVWPPCLQTSDVCTVVEPESASSGGRNPPANRDTLNSQMTSLRERSRVCLLGIGSAGPVKRLRHLIINIHFNPSRWHCMMS